MWYVIIIVLAIIAVKLMEKKFFRWETVVKHLWKGVYAYSYLMASDMQQFDIKEFDELNLQEYKLQIDMRGNLINSILDYINSLEPKENIDAEEETFGYGRYNFEKILMFAKKGPEVFEKLK